MKNTIWVLALSWLVSVESFEPARLRSGEAFIQPPMTAGGGEVLLELEVAASGEVTGVTTLRTTPPFGDLLRQAASGWRFEPAREVQEDPDAPIAVDPPKPRPPRRFSARAPPPPPPRPPPPPPPPRPPPPPPAPRARGVWGGGGGEKTPGGKTFGVD